MTHYNLSGKTALVTGGSRGIGRSIVLHLAQSGADVAFTYRSKVDEANALVVELQQLGRKAAAYQSEAANTKQAEEVVQSVIKEFGGIDILINNAGITKDGLLMRMSEKDWDDVIDTNLKGVFNFTKAATPSMMSKRSGKIVNISSVVGVTGNAGQSNYVASKAGVIGFTKSVAKELASRNIQVNAVAPGFIETDMTEKLNEKQKESILSIIPQKRIAKPEEIATVVCFLVSADANYITGQTINVDGGIAM